MAVTAFTLAVWHTGGRSEAFELRGPAIVNSNAPDGGVRTTGFVAVAAGQAGTNGNQAAHTPAALDRNLVLNLTADAEDIALLHDLFVGGANRGSTFPGLVVWARTAAPLTTDAPDTQSVAEFGYRIDFNPAARDRADA